MLGDVILAVVYVYCRDTGRCDIGCVVYVYYRDTGRYDIGCCICLL